MRLLAALAAAKALGAQPRFHPACTKHIGGIKVADLTL
jgi:hypothetical protein